MKYRYYEAAEVRGWYSVIEDDGIPDLGEFSVVDNPQMAFTMRHHSPICACYGTDAKEHAEKIVKLLNDSPGNDHPTEGGVDA